MIMNTSAEKQLEHFGETKGIADHDHDMIHELSKRLDAVWRFDQYIANAEGHEELKKFWIKLKEQEVENVEQLKHLIARHAAGHCFSA
jgi:hypothetical protein